MLCAASINVTGQCNDDEIQQTECLNGGSCQVKTVDDKRQLSCKFVALTAHLPC